MAAGGLEANDADEQHGDEEGAQGEHCFFEEDHADEHGTEGADAGPDRVGGAHGECLHDVREQPEAHEHAGDGEEAVEVHGETVGELHAGCPKDFTDAGDEETEPSHIVSSFLPRSQKKSAQSLSSKAC